MIELKDVRAGYDGREILHGVSLSFREGEVLALVGPNGCGKSTLLKTLVRLAPLHSGEVLLNGQRWESLRQDGIAREIAYLPQSRPVPDISVESMVLHGRFPYLHYPRKYGKEDIRIAKRAMEDMGIADLADSRIQQLSGGTRQKVYLAMAIAQDAGTVLLDEPTTYLDISHQLRLLEMTKHFAAQGKAVVMVLHDLPLVMRWADRVAVLENGSLADLGTPEEIYARGSLNRVFGVKLSRFQTETGWQYYYM